MHHSLTRHKFVTLVMLFSTNFSHGGEIFSSREEALPKQSNTYVHIAVARAELFALPDASTAPIWTADWMQALPVDPKRMAQAPKGWIPIQGTDGKAAARDKGARPNVWIQRSEVAIAADFKRVTGCWPVKSATLIEGEYSAEVRFQPDGSARVKDAEYESNHRRPIHKAHVYMAGSIVSIDSIDKRGPTFFISAYLPEQRQLQLPGGDVVDQELYSENALKGCTGKPLIAP